MVFGVDSHIYVRHFTKIYTITLLISYLYFFSKLYIIISQGFQRLLIRMNSNIYMVSKRFAGPTNKLQGIWRGFNNL